MLCSYLAERAPVTVALQNKVRVTGRIKAFDSYVVIMEGAKREILYRHAISSIALQNQVEIKHLPSSLKPAQVTKPALAKMPVKPVKTSRPSPPSPRPHQPALPVADDQQITNSMKEGLLRWMQEQKAAK